MTPGGHRTVARSLLAAAILLTLGCESAAYRLRPVAWAPQPEHYWARQFDGFALRTGAVGGVLDAPWLTARFEVLGNTSDVALTAAWLQTASGRYPGMIDARTASVPPGGGALNVFWDIASGAPVPEVLGEEAEIVLDVEVGRRPQTVRVEYRRASCC
jgi:hypothetical protein